MQEDQGKKNPGTGDASGVDDTAAAQSTPAALSDGDLEKVAGGGWIRNNAGTNLAPLDPKIANPKFTIG